MVAPLARPDRPTALSIASLALTRFRCYDHISLELSPEPVIITGSNGAGKTNILEAVSLLVPGRGLRNASLDLLHKNSSAEDPKMAFADSLWGVAATVRTPQGMVSIGTGADPLKQNDKRVVRINERDMRSQVHLGYHMAACYLTPQQDTLFLEGNTARRNYLDRLTVMFAPEHPRHLAVFERAKAERLKLLSHASQDTSWLNVLEERMAERGVAIAAARVDTANQLQHAIDDDDSPFPKATLAASGLLEDLVASGQPALQIESFYRDLLCEQRHSDAQFGKTQSGPHRSDFIVTHRLKNMPAEMCSTGEQKALLLAITLASARARMHWINTVPVLLLDEVVAHLDAEKREALRWAIEALGAQCWMTGTDSSFFAGFQGKAQFFTIESSRIFR